jgi:hypothetical protein
MALLRQRSEFLLGTNTEDSKPFTSDHNPLEGTVFDSK